MENKQESSIPVETQEQDFEGFELLSDEVKAFLRYHGPQLLNSGFPMETEMVEKLYTKLTQSTYDAGNRSPFYIKRPKIPDSGGPESRAILPAGAITGQEARRRVHYWPLFLVQVRLLFQQKLDTRSSGRK